MSELREQGIPLDGGVASDVRIVETPDGPLVVKKALAKLKVAADWFSDPARSMIEVAAIDAFGSLGGRETVPEIVWARPDENCFAMRLVDTRLRNWKSDLLAGRIDLDTAARVGDILGRFHRNSAERPELAGQFEDLRFFRELRIEPFFDFVAAQRPDLASRINGIAESMLERRQSLVHGDYSPKNILADGKDVVVLDFEVTHWGDPRFDIAFCLAHLVLKSAMQDGSPQRMALAIDAFLGGYRLSGMPVIDADLAHVTGCLLLARLYGKSPADYLARIDVHEIADKARELIDFDRAPIPSDFFVFPEQHS